MNKYRTISKKEMPHDNYTNSTDLKSRAAN